VSSAAVTRSVRPVLNPMAEEFGSPVPSLRKERRLQRKNDPECVQLVGTRKANWTELS